MTYSCVAQKKTISHKKSYTPMSEDLLDAKFVFFHNTDSTSVLFYMLNPGNLLFTRQDTGMQFYAVLSIRVFLYNQKSNVFSDSSSDVIYIKQNQQQVFNQLIVKSNNENYNVKIIISDLNRKQKLSYVTELNISTPYTRQNFLVTKNDSLLFKPYASAKSNIKIYHRKIPSTLNIDVFKYNHTPALPPFSSANINFEYNPDSSYRIKKDSINNYFALKAPLSGFYHIKIDEKEADGYTLFGIDSIFPNIRDAAEMLYATRYIMNKSEYGQCLNNTKQCIDNFWIQIAGSKERAKELIKNYYQRVIDANNLFTSYKYGWQTDRGMIYIIFGPPDNINKTAYSEKWTYNTTGQPNGITFNFLKAKNNLFVTNDFILERSDYYKDLWYIAVEKIRQGRICIK